MSLEASLLTSARLSRIINYTNVASCALWIYDSFGTLDLEVELIWQARWGIGKMLFVLSRYSPLVDLILITYYSFAPNITFETCTRLTVAMFSSALFGAGMAQAVIVLRTYALLGNKRRIFALLSLLSIAGVTTAIVIATLFLRSLRFGEPPLPGTWGCYAAYRSKSLLANFVMLIVSETTIMILTLWIGYKREFHRSPSRLVVVLYRDGILYYMYIILLALGNLTVLAAGPPELFDLLNLPQRIIHSIMTTRILLHVRSVAIDNGSHTDDFQLGARSQIVSQIVFRNRNQPLDWRTANIQFE